MAEKIFCISFHKSGTSSFHGFLVNAGISSKHYPAKHHGRRLMRKCSPLHSGEQIYGILRCVIDSYDGHSDIPWPGLVPELIKHHPHARFVLITRNPEKWWNSVKTHWRLSRTPRYLTNFERIQFRDYIGDKRIIYNSDKELMVLAYAKHVQRCKDLMHDAHFCHVELDDPSISEKLSQFLKLDSVIQFPHLQNKTAKMPRLLSTRRVFWFGYNAFLHAAALMLGLRTARM